MKFKIGQKVRVKQWLDMPKGLVEVMGINTYGVGSIGTVDSFSGEIQGIKSYRVNFDGKGSLYAFEPELEPLVRIGEQLMFNFMKK